MAYKVIHSTASDSDLNLIFRYLVDSYVALGDALPDAFNRAVRRVNAIQADVDALGVLPHQGTLIPHLGVGVREVTKKRAIIYFHIDDDTSTIRVIAVFFGGQDHLRHMLIRLGDMEEPKLP